MKFFFLLFLFISFPAFAWGPTGHRVVGEVAQKNLSPKTLTKVKALLNGEDLSRVSNWPDEIKSDPDKYGSTFRWHYTDWPDEMKEHTEANSSGSLIGSINEQLAVLKDKKANHDKKVFALKFLVHLVGDVHMPLHVGSGLDRGGNTCKVLFHGQPTNLHELWDEGMINFTQLSYTELSRYVAQGRSSAEINEWKKGKLLDWAEESKKIRTEVYPADVNPAVGVSRKYCRLEPVVKEDEMPKLAYEYSYRFLPVLERRLFQAGLRLAVLLNDNLR